MGCVLEDALELIFEDPARDPVYSPPRVFLLREHLWGNSMTPCLQRSFNSSGQDSISSFDGKMVSLYAGLGDLACCSIQLWQWATHFSEGRALVLPPPHRDSLPLHFSFMAHLPSRGKASTAASVTTLISSACYRCPHYIFNDCIQCSSALVKNMSECYGHGSN